MKYGILLCGRLKNINVFAALRHNINPKCIKCNSYLHKYLNKYIFLHKYLDFLLHYSFCGLILKQVIKKAERRNTMIKVGIIGATGYAGAEIVRLIQAHPQAEVVWYGSRSFIDEKYSSIYGNLFKLVDAKCMDDNMEELAKAADVIFTATPQGLCASLVNEDILNKVKIIDLSADFRLKDVSVYEKWYKIEHKAPSFIEEAVYGLCEINRDKIKGARLIANPGCYTTCSILTAYPLIHEGLIDPDTL